MKRLMGDGSRELAFNHLIEACKELCIPLVGSLCLDINLYTYNLNDVVFEVVQGHVQKYLKASATFGPDKQWVPISNDWPASFDRCHSQQDPGLGI
jgi:hypothetical protein